MRTGGGSLFRYMVDWQVSVHAYIIGPTRRKVKLEVLIGELGQLIGQVAIRPVALIRASKALSWLIAVAASVASATAAPWATGAVP